MLKKVLVTKIFLETNIVLKNWFIFNCLYPARISKAGIQWDETGQIHCLYSVSLPDKFVKLRKFYSKWRRKFKHIKKLPTLNLSLVQIKWEAFQFIMDFVSNGPHLHSFFNISQNFGGYVSWQSSFNDSCILVHWEFCS